MSHRLVTFLGKGHYRDAYYAFEGESRARRGEWFPTALLGHLGDHSRRVDVVTVVGGPKSSWWQLIQFWFERLDRELTQLQHSLKDRPLAPNEVAALADRLNEGGHDARMDLRLVEQPLAPNGDQDVLRCIADQLKQGDRVTLDVTHSFRHLPMLGLLAALYLRRVRKVEIGGIFYAALDTDEDDEGRVEVVDLRRLVDLADWIVALGRFDASGDAGVFVDLLEADGNPNEALDALREGAGLERALQTEAAAAALRTAQAGLDETPERALALRGTGAFFADELQQALAWASAPTSFDQNRELARRHLKHRDWLRAAVLMVEACRIRLVEVARPRQGAALDRRIANRNYLNPQNHEGFAHLRAQDADRFDRRWKRYCLLKDLRNALAHAEPDSQEVAAIVRHPSRLRCELKRLYDELLRGPDAFP